MVSVTGKIQSESSEEEKNIAYTFASVIVQGM